MAIAILGVVFIDPIIDGLCSTESLRPLAREYGILVFATSPFYILMPGLGTFVRTDNDTRLATVAFATANVVNVVLAYLLMAHTDMGLSGFAVSTMTGYIVGMAILALHFRKDNISIGFGKGTVGNKEILTMGSPAALAMMLILVNMLGMNLLVMNHMGSEGMVIRSVCLNIQMLSSIFVSGISQTLQPVGGTLYGSEDLSGMRMVTKIAAKYQIAASGTIMVLALLVPMLFLTIYGVTDPAIVPTAEHCIRLFAPFLIFQAVNYMVMIIFQVFGHRPISIAISFMECFFVLIYGIVLAPMDIDLLWLSFFLGEATVSAVVLGMSLVIRRVRPEYEGFALFRKPTGAVFEASVPGDGSSMTEVLDGMEGFMSSNGMESESAKARLCCEEILLNVTEHSLNRDPERFVDVFARMTDDGVLVTIRDDGPIFDPIKHESKGIGLQIVGKVCSSFNYARSVNQNTVFLTFSKS